MVLVVGEERSPEWNKVRKAHLKKDPQCELCNSKSDLEVHHIVPFSIDKKLELSPSNLITGCRSKRFGFNCHLVIFHGGNFKWENPNILEDIKKAKEIIERTQCQKDGCLNNDEFLKFIKELKQRTKDYNCKQYGKCSKGK